MTGIDLIRQTIAEQPQQHTVSQSPLDIIIIIITHCAGLSACVRDIDGWEVAQCSTLNYEISPVTPLAITFLPRLVDYSILLPTNTPHTSGLTVHISYVSV